MELENFSQFTGQAGNYLNSMTTVNNAASSIATVAGWTSALSDFAEIGDILTAGSGIISVVDLLLGGG
jgi:hypothetical protein